MKKTGLMTSCKVERGKTGPLIKYGEQGKTRKTGFDENEGITKKNRPGVQGSEENHEVIFWYILELKSFISCCTGTFKKYKNNLV